VSGFNMGFCGFVFLEGGVSLFVVDVVLELVLSFCLRAQSV